MKYPLLFLFLLLTCNSIAPSAQDSTFRMAVDAINTKLEEWAEPGAGVYITAKTNGNISIINKHNQSLSFNLFDLVTNHNNGSNSKNGIETVPCDKKAHAALTWLNFYTAEKQVAFIRLNCTAKLTDLEYIRNAFLHLKSLCSK